MLGVIIEAGEEWDAIKEEFLPPQPPVKLSLEHSLLSLSKWESKWKVPFLSAQLTPEQAKDYVRCMTLNQGVDPNVYDRMKPDILEKVADYIREPMTATWFTEDKMGLPHSHGKMNGEIVTAEIIYYWMISYHIPFECQKWHLNRLLTLVRVMGEKNKPPKKRSRRETIELYSRLNDERRRKLGTTG